MAESSGTFFVYLIVFCATRIFTVIYLGLNMLIKILFELIQTFFLKLVSKRKTAMAPGCHAYKTRAAQWGYEDYEDEK